jgi:hypothetical protein
MANIEKEETSLEILAEGQTDKAGFLIWSEDDKAGKTVHIGMNNFTFNMTETDFFIFYKMLRTSAEKLLGFKGNDKNDGK